jgi:hypothetical protein
MPKKMGVKSHACVPLTLKSEKAKNNLNSLITNFYKHEKNC